MSERTSKGWWDYEGVEPDPHRRRRTRKLVPPTSSEPDLFAAPVVPVVPAARNRDPATSNEGIHHVLPRAGSQQMRLLRVFADNPMGLTSDEAAEDAGLRVAGCCYWKRVGDLLRAGLLEDTLITREGLSGAEQRVLAITTRGRQVAMANSTEVDDA